MKRIPIAFILVTALVAAPPSVEKLLRKPVRGKVTLQLTNGATADGYIVRVTDQFVTLQRGVDDCEQVQIADIRNVHLSSNSTVGDDIGTGIEITMLSPILAAAFAQNEIGKLVRGDKTFPVIGEWESDQGAVLSVSGKVAERKKVSVTQGTYGVVNGRLLLDTGPMSFSFHCDTMTLTDSQGSRQLRVHGWPAPAAAPVVGRWDTFGTRESDMWIFRRDGTYRIMRAVSSVKGECEKSGKDFVVHWRDGSQSTGVRGRGSLALTTNAVVELFKRTTKSSE